MSTSTTLESLLRGSRLSHGHIQLFRDASGWQAHICHYHRTPRDAVGGKVFDDPLDALHAVLIEDDRVQRDFERRYAAAPKVGDRPPPPASDPFEEMFE